MFYEREKYPLFSHSVTKLIKEWLSVKRDRNVARSYSFNSKNTSSYFIYSFLHSSAINHCISVHTNKEHTIQWTLAGIEDMP